MTRPASSGSTVHGAASADPGSTITGSQVKSIQGFRALRCLTTTPTVILASAATSPIMLSPEVGASGARPAGREIEPGRRRERACERAALSLAAASAPHQQITGLVDVPAHSFL